MMTYILSLLALILLCGLWAVFQLWLSRHDPDAKARSLKCGGCGRQDECR
ncbi:MAG: hypothetical protein WBM80_06015 [Woeseiaceae bacterium]